MKRKKLALRLMGVTILILSAVSVTAAQNGYSGTWVLDKGASKGLPSHVKAYDMVVAQDGQQLVVTSQTEGQVAVGEQGSRKSADTNALIRAETPQGPKTAGELMVGSPGTMGDSSPSNGSLAFRTVVPQVTYTLDGKKTTVTLMGFGQATLIAKPGKNGKSLDLSMTHQETVGGQSLTALVAKERWTLSDDGQVLKVQRTVSTQQSSETVNLTFRKKPAAP
jgi:hypothetical protein